MNESKMHHEKFFGSHKMCLVEEYQKYVIL